MAAAPAVGATRGGEVRRFQVEGRAFELRVADLPRCGVLAAAEAHESAQSGGPPVVELPGRSAQFFEMLAAFLSATEAERAAVPAAYDLVRCVLPAPASTSDLVGSCELGAFEASFVPLCSAPDPRQCVQRLIDEGPNASPTTTISFELGFETPSTCTELCLIAPCCPCDSAGGAASTARPCRVEARVANGEWRALELRRLPSGEADGGTQVTRRLLSGAAPICRFQVPAVWHDGGRLEALFWTEVEAYEVFELEIAMARRILEKLLRTYLAGKEDAIVFKAWPSRDRHQLWAALWLALRFCPGRLYSQAEAAWVVAWHLDCPSTSLVLAVRAELERRGFLTVGDEETDAGLRLSKRGVRWVLDGDKLFRARRHAGDCQASGAADRAWWALPLATQHLALAAGATAGAAAPPPFDWRAAAGLGDEPAAGAPRARFRAKGREFDVDEVAVRRFPGSLLARCLDGAGPGGGACVDLPGRDPDFLGLVLDFIGARCSREESPMGFATYRCVLLDPGAADQAPAHGEENAVVEFVPATEDNVTAEYRWALVTEGAHVFAAVEAAFPRSVACSEVRVVSLGVSIDGRSGPTERVPPLRIDVQDGGAWRTIKWQAMPALEEQSNCWRGATRCFIPGAVPVQSFAVPEAWQGDPARAAAAAGEAEHHGLEALSSALARAVAARWLEENTGSRTGQGSLLVGSPLALRQWPSKDRQQLWAAVWVALHLWPGRLYREAEVDWVIATRFVPSQVPDCPTIRKELERRGLVSRVPGGGGFCASPEGLRGPLSGLHVAKGSM